MHLPRPSLRPLLCFVAFTALLLSAARADDLSKLNRMVGLLHHEAYRSASTEALARGAANGLRQELTRRGLDASFLNGSLQDQFRAASDHYPQLDADGTLLNACVQGMAGVVNDPYAAYLGPDTFQSLMTRIDGDAQGGPGLSVVKDHPGDNVEVLETAEGTPAAVAHLGPGDSILDIDGTSTIGLTIDQARGRLQGPPGSVVSVTVKRAHQSAPEHVTLMRTKLDSRTVEAHIIPANGQKVGYVRIRSFGARTGAELNQALDQLHEHGATSLVLDLRNNGGGLVYAAVSVCSNFLPEGSTVVTVNRRAAPEVHYAGYGQRPRMPLVVLVNQNSASAAEITAGAIHDSGAGTLVGVRSFGKGTVQRFIPLGDGSALKLTTAHYRTPAGNDIHGVGITPDIVVDTQAAIGAPADTQLARALQEAVKGLGAAPRPLGGINGPSNP